MMTNTSPMTLSATWDGVAAGYSETTQKHLGALNAQALAPLSLSNDVNVLDIGCGPGTACIPLAPWVKHIDAVDFAPEMLERLRMTILEHNIANVKPLHADGQNIPLPSKSYDLVYSFFGLMFFADRRKGFAEIARLLKPGGLAIVSSWPPYEESSAAMAIMTAFESSLPPNPGGNMMRMPLSNREEMEAEVTSAGLQLRDFRKIKYEYEVKSAAEFVADSIKGGAPLQVLMRSMPMEQWNRVVESAIAHLNGRYKFPAKFGMVANYAYITS